MSDTQPQCVAPARSAALWAAHSQRCALAYRIVDSCAELASVSHLHLVRGGRKISFRMGGLDTGSGRWLGCMGTGHWQQTAMQAKLGCNLTLPLDLGDGVDAITHAEHWSPIPKGSVNSSHSWQQSAQQTALPLDHQRPLSFARVDVVQLVASHRSSSRSRRSRRHS
jgi:hypothetical protein